MWNDNQIMNWKLILQLSLFGLVMGLATVFLIPSAVEPAFWLVIFLISAYLIAKRAPGKPFLHGLLLGLANSVWITLSHILFFSQYIATHAQEAAMMSSMPAPDSPRLMMAATGPLIGLISGVIIGLLAVVTRRLVTARGQ